MPEAGRERLAKRLGLMPKIPPITIRNDAPESFRVGLYAAIETLFIADDLRTIVCGAIGVMPNSSNWSRPNILREIQWNLERCEWLKVYEVAEAIYERLNLPGRHDLPAWEFEQRVNGLLVDLGIGFKMVKGAIQPRDEALSDLPPPPAGEQKPTAGGSATWTGGQPGSVEPATTKPAEADDCPEVDRELPAERQPPSPDELPEPATKVPFWIKGNAQSSSTGGAKSESPVAHAEAKVGDINITINLPPGVQPGGVPTAAVQGESASPAATEAEEPKPASALKSINPDAYVLVVDPLLRTVDLYQLIGETKSRRLAVIAKPGEPKVYKFITEAMGRKEQLTHGNKDTAKRIRYDLREALKNDTIDLVSRQP